MLVNKFRNPNPALSILSAVVAGFIGISACTAPALAAQHAAHHAAPEVTEEKIGSRSYQVSRIVVKARPEHVWQILTDFNGAPAVFSTLKKSHLVENKGAVKVVHQEVRPSGVLDTYSYDLEVKEVAAATHKMMEWKRLRGDFREVEGFWKLDAAEGGHATLVTYASYVNGGFFVPQILVKRQTRIDMPQAMLQLKKHAESHVRLATSDMTAGQP